MESLNSRIEEIITSKGPTINSYSEIIEMCHWELLLLRKKVEESGFLNEQDEILFFKKTKQFPLSNLIYYNEIRKITLEVETCKDKSRNQLLKSNLKYYLQEIKKHKEFNSYMRLGYSHFDKYYFLRSSKTLLPKQITYSSIFNSFTTSHDYLMAKLNAYNRLTTYLKKELTKKNQISCLKWTSSKSSLVELIYALYYSKACNDGKCDLNTIAIGFQQIFDIDLHDIYRVFLEIKRRKNNRLKFLTEIKINLTNRLDLEDS